MGHLVRGEGTRRARALVTRALTRVVTAVQGVAAHLTTDVAVVAADPGTTRDLAAALTAEAALPQGHLARRALAHVARVPARVCAAAEQAAADLVAHQRHLALDPLGGGAAGAGLGEGGGAGAGRHRSALAGSGCLHALTCRGRGGTAPGSCGDRSCRRCPGGGRTPPRSCAAPDPRSCSTPDLEPAK